MATVAAKTSFFHLAVLLDKIQKLSGTDQKKRLLREFIDEWRKFHKSLHKDDPSTVGQNLFLNFVFLKIPPLYKVHYKRPHPTPSISLCINQYVKSTD